MTAPVIPAATVLLLRDGRDGLEVFMVRRHYEIDSFSGALVFPGGKVDANDAAPELREFCDGADGLGDVELQFRVAAIREAFEEAGVLLARAVGEVALLPAARVEALDALRKPLAAGETTLAALCRRENIRLACDRLVRFAHWITPKQQPKIFDTQFFLAAAPTDQVALHDGEETLESAWIGPAHALAEADAGRRSIVFPTRTNLGKLARWQDIDAAMAAAAEATVVTVQPQITPHDEGRIMRIPAAADYGFSEILLRPDSRVIRVIA